MSTAGARQASQRARRAKRNERKAPPSFYWWPITPAKIRHAANQIAQAVRPEKIILFGSFAYGKPTPDSDVDLLIIMNSDLRPQFARLSRSRYWAYPPVSGAAHTLRDRHSLSRPGGYGQ